MKRHLMRMLIGTSVRVCGLISDVGVGAAQAQHFGGHRGGHGGYRGGRGGYRGGHGGYRGGHGRWGGHGRLGAAAADGAATADTGRRRPRRLLGRRRRPRGVHTARPRP